MDKCVEMFRSIFAIHKAGGAYVPLDPEFPSERIQPILKMSESKIVLTSVELNGKFKKTMVGCNIGPMSVDVAKLLATACKPEVEVTRSDICTLHVRFMMHLLSCVF